MSQGVVDGQFNPIDAIYQQKFYEAQDLLAQFVPYQTVNLPGNEQPLAKFIQTILQREGFSTEIQVVDQNRANLIATIGTGSRKIIFNGHLDVVPPGEGWSVPPFVLSEQGSRLYGRGSCDMKGGITAMVAAAIMLWSRCRCRWASPVLSVQPLQKRKCSPIAAHRTFCLLTRWSAQTSVGL